MLSFLFPWFLAAAGTAAIPVILHLLRRQPEPRVKFAAVKLLRAAPVEHSEKRRLRELLLLALRAGALVLLAVAFARPFRAAASTGPAAGVTVVALDTSYSLSAPGRFARAQSMAREAIGRVATGDLVSLVTFDDRASVVVAPTADRTLATAAVDRASTGFGGTEYAAALTAAGQQIGDRRGRIVVVTDLQDSGWNRAGRGDRASVPESVAVEVADVGEAPPNFAVIAVRIDPAAGAAIVATISNTATAARDTRARLVVDGREVQSAAVALGGRASADVTFNQVSGRDAMVIVDDRDGLQADNSRFMTLGPPAGRSVLVVTGFNDLAVEALYLEQALTAGPAGAYQVTGASGRDVTTWSPERLASFSTVFVLSTRGLERRGREALASYAKTGGGVVIVASPDVDGDVAADLIAPSAGLKITVQENPATAMRLAPADTRHPLFRAFGSDVSLLGRVRFDRAAQIASRTCEVLGRFTDGEAAVVDCPAEKGRVIALASDLNNRWNDFPRHPSYVPFVRELVAYAAGSLAGRGEFLVGEAPRGVALRPGISTIPGEAGASPRTVVVNVDPQEGDPQRTTAAEFEQSIGRLRQASVAASQLARREREERQQLWWYGLAAALMALAGEGIIANRTA